MCYKGIYANYFVVQSAGFLYIVVHNCRESYQTRWGKNQHFMQKFTYLLKIPIFTKFTFSKSQFSQNSHF